MSYHLTHTRTDAPTPVPFVVPLDGSTKWAGLGPVHDAFEDTWTIETSFGTGPDPGEGVAGRTLYRESCWATHPGSDRQGLFFAGRPGFRAIAARETAAGPPNSYERTFRRLSLSKARFVPPEIDEFYPLRSFSIAEIDEVSVQLRTDGEGIGVTVNVYTVPENSQPGWYGHRLQAVAGMANGGDPAVEPGEFATFSTDTLAENTLRFFDAERADSTAGMAYPDPSDQVELADLQRGPVEWGDGPLDYRDETVLGLSIETDGPAIDEATYVAGASVSLSTGEKLLVDLGGDA